MSNTESKVCKFTSPSGEILVARRATHYTGSRGWYGGINVQTYERCGFSCGSGYYFDGDIALLGTIVDELERDIDDDSDDDCAWCCAS